jgi:hypothetical protein
MDFSSVKLKKTITKKAEGLKPVICANDADYQKLMKETFLEEYLEQLGDELTFPTMLLPLTADAQADLHRSFEEKTDYSEFESLSLLSRQIQTKIEESGWKEVFVRLR